MAFEKSLETRAYVHNSTHTSQHVQRVFFTEELDTEVSMFGARLELLRHTLYELRHLQIHVHQHRVTLTWWAPQRSYRPCHLDAQEAQETVTMSVVDLLASSLGWPLLPQITHVDELSELIVIERQQGVNWGLGGNRH